MKVVCSRCGATVKITPGGMPRDWKQHIDADVQLRCIVQQKKMKEHGTVQGFDCLHLNDALRATLERRVQRRR